MAVDEKGSTGPYRSAISQAAASNTPSEPVYHTIKNGDNPWKIAKQFRIKVEDLLRLNDLDEAKARNLKVGEKIRIR